MKQDISTLNKDIEVYKQTETVSKTQLSLLREQLSESEAEKQRSESRLKAAEKTILLLQKYQGNDQTDPGPSRVSKSFFWTFLSLAYANQAAHVSYPWSEDLERELKQEITSLIRYFSFCYISKLFWIIVCSDRDRVLLQNHELQKDVSQLKDALHDRTESLRELQAKTRSIGAHHEDNASVRLGREESLLQICKEQEEKIIELLQQQAAIEERVSHVNF